MEGYRLVRTQEVEFRDLDGLGHVNNAVYLSYLENAKVYYLREVVGAGELETLGIVADVQIAYRSPAFFGETLLLGLRVRELGTKSIRFEFAVDGPDGRRVAEGSSVHVAFDYETRQPTPLPDEWRRRIEAYEAESLAAT